MRLINICFHHTAEDITVWHDFAKYLSEKLNEEFSIASYKSLREEQEALLNEEYDLAFQNPETAQLLFSKGYKPIGRLNEQWDTVCYFSKKDLVRGKKFYRVGIVPLRVVYSTLIELEQIGLNINQIDFMIYKNLEDIKSAVIYGEIDIGITRKDSFIKFSEEEKSQLQIIYEFGMGIFHSFMVKESDPEFLEKTKNVLHTMHLNDSGLSILKRLGSDKVVDIGYEFGFLERLNSLGNKIFEYRDYKSIFNAVEKVTNVGIVIFREKVEYANDYVKNITEYFEDLIGVDVVKLLAPSQREESREFIRRCIEGEFFDIKYDSLKILTKNNDEIVCMGFASTIIYNGKPYGMLVFVDIRRRVFLENLLKVSGQIGNLFFNVPEKKIILQRIGEILFGKLELDYIRITFSDSKKCTVEFEKGKPLKQAIKYGELNNEIKENVVYDNGRIKHLTIFIPVSIGDMQDVLIETHTSRHLRFHEELKIFFEKLKNDISILIDRADTYFQNQYLFIALNSSKDFFMMLDEEFKIIYVNKAVKDITGYSSGELLGKNPEIFKSEKLSKSFYEDLHKKIAKNEQFEGVFINKNKYGDIFYLNATAIPMVNNNEFKGVFFIGKNITNEVLLESEINKVKFEDYLTGLHNYVGLKVNSSRLIELNPENISAFIICDIQNMSVINSEHGFEFGNEVLKYVANSLKELLKKRDLIARIGGDDFAVFASNIKEKENVIKILDRIKSFFKDSILISSVKIFVKLKISVVIYPFDGKSADELLNKCSLTLSNIKKKEDVEIEFYNDELSKEVKKSIYVDKLLAEGLLFDRFILHYQPYFYTNTLEVAGFEALVRVKDENGKIIFPGDFIDYLENSIYLDEFERWLVKKSEEIIKNLEYPLSINLSAKNLNIDNLKRLIDGLDNGILEKLTIEVTEWGVNDNFLLFSEDFNKYKDDRKFKIAIDDFGTGYSSLTRLKQMACDTIKIDISFIRDMFKSSKDTLFVQAIIELANRFGYKVLAEGVEDIKQFNYLRDNNCELAQGYLLSKPVDEDTLISTDWKLFAKKLKERLDSR